MAYQQITGEWFQQFSPAPIVPFEKERDTTITLDFTEANNTLTNSMLADIDQFCGYINSQLNASGARYGIGGYNEHRTVYNRSKVFDGVDEKAEPRRLHLGTDIWGVAGTPVFAPLAGTIHSFAFNNQYSDYGATIIIAHTINDITLHSLYGHLSLRDLDKLYEGKNIQAGEAIAHFGEPHENGYWPPHLHFQLIWDMEGKKGDYPGVCRFSERTYYLANCPNPMLLICQSF